MSIICAANKADLVRTQEQDRLKSKLTRLRRLHRLPFREVGFDRLIPERATIFFQDFNANAPK